MSYIAVQILGLQLPLIRRDPHYFLPTTDERYIMFGSDLETTRRQFKQFFSAQDWCVHVFTVLVGAALGARPATAMAHIDQRPAHAWRQLVFDLVKNAERVVMSRNITCTPSAPQGRRQGTTGGAVGAAGRPGALYAAAAAVTG